MFEGQNRMINRCFPSRKKKSSRKRGYCSAVRKAICRGQSGLDVEYAACGIECFPRFLYKADLSDSVSRCPD